MIRRFKQEIFFQFDTVSFKASVNEETLLRKHVTEKMFPKCLRVCSPGKHLFRKQNVLPGSKKCFWTWFQLPGSKFCFRNKCFSFARWRNKASCEMNEYAWVRWAWAMLKGWELRERIAQFGVKIYLLHVGDHMMVLLFVFHTVN